MSIFLLGPLIRQKREELGMTQEDLADGICSVPTLSRIENGERLPNKSHSEMLLQRLGYSDTLQVNYVPEKTLELHELKYQIRQAIIKNHREEGAALLNRFEAESDPEDCISKQFILVFKTILDDSLDHAARLERFLEAIRMTCPKFDSKELPPFLAYEEIIVINNIALCMGETGKLEEAIALLFALDRHYDCKMLNQEEILRTQLMVLYNLARFLSIAGQLDACIKICSKGIQISQETRRCSHLDRLLFYRAQALLERNQPGDFDLAEESARLAICAAEALGSESVLIYRRFMREFFDQNYWSKMEAGNSHDEIRIS
ncbi:MAG: helix-turn-helix domain-containing protein [Oscillospiraceae bacterium]|nr:helix-turn-helix domain-containing protein [Oscillospiraceae bacterium]